MVVAQLRGVEFDDTVNTEEEWYPVDSDEVIARNALKDVYNWLGFDRVDDYLKTSSIEGRDILKRASNIPNDGFFTE